MSSMMASVSSSMRSAGGTPRPVSDSTPTANAMSVAVGIAQPRRASRVGADGEVQQRRHQHAPERGDDRQGRDARLRECAVVELAADLESHDQKENASSGRRSPRSADRAPDSSGDAEASLQVPQRLICPAQGELAQPSASAAAASSTTPLIASTLTKRSSHGPERVAWACYGKLLESFSDLAVITLLAARACRFRGGPVRRTPHQA